MKRLKSIHISDLTNWAEQPSIGRILDMIKYPTNCFCSQITPVAHWQKCNKKISIMKIIMQKPWKITVLKVHLMLIQHFMSGSCCSNNQLTHGQVKYTYKN